jgi:hypothetical protein
MEASMNAPSHDDMTKRVRAYSKFMDFKFYSGIATFFRANLCDDWTEVDIALVGLPTDIGLTQRTGARHGPREIRSQSSNVPYYNPLTKIIPFELARIADIGDVQLVSAFNLDNVIAEIGTGTPAVGGITSYEAKRLLQGLHGTDIVTERTSSARTWSRSRRPSILAALPRLPARNSFSKCSALRRNPLRGEPSDNSCAARVHGLVVGPGQLGIASKSALHILAPRD